MSSQSKSLVSVVFAVAASAATAQLAPEQFDIDKSEAFETEEYAFLKKAVANLPEGEEKDHYDTQVYLIDMEIPAGQPVPVERVQDFTKTRSCTKDKGRFVLRRNVTNTHITGCQALDKTKGGKGYKPFSEGASLALNYDGVNNKTQWTVNGGFAYVFPGPKSNQPLGEGGTTADWGFAVFLQADGTVRDDNDDPGTVRVGGKAEVVRSFSYLPALELNLLTYFQTDLELKGRGYGFEASFVPYKASARLNSSFRNKGEKELYFVVKPTLDAFYVDEQGLSGLTAGDTYIWLGGEFGVEAFRDDITSFGTSLRAGVKPYWDLKTGEEAIDGYADINMFLNKQRTAAFKIGYRYGTPRSTLVKRETLDIGFALAF